MATSRSRRLLIAGGFAVFGHLLIAAPAVPNMLLLDGAVAGAEILAVGERGTILGTNDQGRTWEARPAAVEATLTGISFAPDGRRGWVVGHDALILATEDGGRSWRKQWQGENLTDSFLDVIALDERHVIAVGAFGLFVETTDGGTTWRQRQLLEDDYHLNRLSRGTSGTLYLAGEHGTLLRSRDQGATWDGIYSPYDGSFYGILPLSDTRLLAYGLRGRLYLSEDDGDTWEPVANEQRNLMLTALAVAPQRVIAAGQARAFVALDLANRTLQPAYPGMQTAVAELLPLADGSLLCLGEAGATVLPPAAHP